LCLASLIKVTTVLSIFVKVLIVDVNSIKSHVAHDLGDSINNLIFPTKAVLPTIIVITSPASAHSSTTKAENNLLACILPLGHKCRVGRIVTNRWFRNLACLTTDIFGRTPLITHSKCNHDMCVFSNLGCCWTGFPITNVRN